MPFGDGTGPRWAGKGWRCRRAMGRGRMDGSELEMLKSYSESLVQELESVRSRIAELEK
jgi:hypothetical protein